MQTLKQQLPPLGPLIAFEAAARYLSFTEAARELNLSQAAVSQQIRNLEESLGIPLFIRAHKSVQLSARGRELQHTVTSIFQQLATATAELKDPLHPTRITVAADQSVASMWLMPRLPRFQRRFPEVSVRLIASDLEQDCLGEEVELAIIHGNGRWPGFEVEPFFGEEIYPVCSPGYLDSKNGNITPESLVDENLLELDDTHWDWMNWRTWLSQNDIHLPARHKGLQVNNYPMLIDAVKNGQGIALGWRYLVDDDIARGTLVKPMELSIHTALGYFLVRPEMRSASSAVEAFRQWCQSELKSESIL